MPAKDASTWVGVAGFEPAASSSRSQVAVLTARAAACLAWETLSADVRWRPWLSVAIVTWLLGRSRAGIASGGLGVRLATRADLDGPRSEAIFGACG